MVSHFGKLKVSVGIPAYNEGGNIKSLVLQVLAQQQSSFKLHEIIVISDGSTDNTDEEVRSIGSPLVRLVRDGARRGKVARQNELFQIFSGDVLVSFDADIHLPAVTVLERVVAPFYTQNSVDLVCGVHWPLRPRTLIEKLAYFGADYWETAKNMLGEKGDMYNCLGQIRAFSRSLATSMVVPEDVGTFEDTYSFLYAKVHNFTVVVAHDARVEFRLPSHIMDYLRQMSRYIKVRRSAASFFKPEEVAQFHHVTARVKLAAFLGTAKKYSIFLSIGYICLQLVTALYGLMIRQNTIWAVSSSTKAV